MSTTNYRQTKAIVIDYPALAQCLADLGGVELDVEKLLLHFCDDRRMQRVLRQIHVVANRHGLSDHTRAAFNKIGAAIHEANGDRTECLVFLHAERMAERFDVVSLLVTNSGYLPLIRHIKSFGACLELQVIPSAEPALFSAADVLVGLYPPGAPIRRARELSDAA